MNFHLSARLFVRVLHVKQFVTSQSSFYVHVHMYLRVLPRELWRQGVLRLTGWLRNTRYAFMLACYALISVVQTYCTRKYYVSFILTYVHVQCMY